MNAPQAEPDAEPDVTRRTLLAAERTWLAWWRTGVGVTAAAVGIGRLLPSFTNGARWPLQLLGIGYGVLALAVLLIGALRQHRADAALRSGGYEPLSSSLVNWLTLAGVALGLATLAIIVLAI